MPEPENQMQSKKAKHQQNGYQGRVHYDAVDYVAFKQRNDRSLQPATSTGGPGMRLESACSQIGFKPFCNPAEHRVWFYLFCLIRFNAEPALNHSICFSL